MLGTAQKGALREDGALHKRPSSRSVEVNAWQSQRSRGGGGGVKVSGPQNFPISGCVERVRE